MSAGEGGVCGGRVTPPASEAPKAPERGHGGSRWVGCTRPAAAMTEEQRRDAKRIVRRGDGRGFLHMPSSERARLVEEHDRDAVPDGVDELAPQAVDLALLLVEREVALAAWAGEDLLQLWRE